MKNLLPLIVVCLSGCASQPIGESVTAKELLASVCEPGSQVESVTGSVSIRADSTEASGRFPADLRVEEKDSKTRMTMEISNPFGGTEARIEVRGNRYRISVPGKPKRGRSGSGSWGGIPLRFAPELLLGRFPCPSRSQDVAHKIQIRKEKDELQVRAETSRGVEMFLYSFVELDKKPWPKRLHWERLHGENQKVVVDFEFMDPDAELQRSPSRWVAKSQKGSVDMRWRDRQISLKPTVTQ